MAKQTAVGFLVQELVLESKIDLDTKTRDLIYLASEIEEELLNKACYDGYYHEGMMNTKEYYDKTYRGSKMSNQELTVREKEIITLLSKGLFNKEIAELLYVNRRTVESHLYSIYKKLQVKNRIEALNKIKSKL